MIRDDQVEEKIARFLKRKSGQYPEINYLAKQMLERGK